MEMIKIKENQSYLTITENWPVQGVDFKNLKIFNLLWFKQSLDYVDFKNIHTLVLEQYNGSFVNVDLKNIKILILHHYNHPLDDLDFKNVIFFSLNELRSYAPKRNFSNLLEILKKSKIKIFQYLLGYSSSMEKDIDGWIHISEINGYIRI